MIMASKRVLLMYISEDSGHHCASLAIEKAIHQLSPASETLNINAFNYTNPILEKVINRAYMSVLKRKPEIWDYLYDNPKVLEKTRRLRSLIHGLNSPKLKVLMGDFKPDTVVCTQAFPCGMVADYKKTYELDLPLVGVLTDYAPHSYWVYNNVDYYVVPSEETGRKLIQSGVDERKIKPFGIPLDLNFKKPSERQAVSSSLGLDPFKPMVLIMGGTQGLGPIKELVLFLNDLSQPMQIVIVCGTNRKLYRWLSRRMKGFKKKTLLYGFTHNISELMTVASVIVTKAGGITTAEALAKGLPMVILHPLPGQEAMNTAYLLREGTAVKAENIKDCAVILEELLYNEAKLHSMSLNAKRCSRPESALDIANLILGVVK